MTVLTERWYAHADDLIGCWAVLNRDCPPTQLDWDSDPSARYLGKYLSEDIARHVVELHNASLEGTR
jgi:hypothetical protein